MKNLFSKLMLVALAVATFTACEDVPEPYDIPGTGDNTPGGNTEVIEDATGTGTLDDPFNAAAALNYGSKLQSGEESTDYMYIKGKVVSIKEEFTTQYGNGTFYISSDGTAKNQFYAYRVRYLGDKKFTASDTQIKIGDDVIVCGIITNYNGTIETAQNKGFLYSLNGENRGGEPGQGTATGEATGDGTLQNPFNSVAAINYCKTVGDTESPKDVYIKGKVASITDQYGTQYGNGTFTISDDGSSNGAFTVYRALYLGNKKYTSGDLLKEGDEVIVCGRVTNFKGNTPETVQGKAYLYSLNGKTDEGGDTPQPGGEATGKGTQDDPYNVAKALQVCEEVGEAGTSTEVYAKGIITEIKEVSTQYGNATFTISDDASASNGLTVYRAYSLDNKKFTSENEIKVGDEVVICGKLVNFKGNTPEFTQGCYIYSLTGKSDGGGGGDTPNPGDGNGSGTLTDPYNAVAATQIATDLGSGNTSEDSYYIKGKISTIKYTFDVDHGTATFFISDDGQAQNEFQVYSAYYLENKSWQSHFSQIKVGDDVIIYGQLTNFNGTPETASKKAYIYSLNGNTKAEEGGEQGGESGGEVTGNSITIDFAAQGYENAQDISTVTLSDGTTLTFSAGDNKNGPKYYNSGSAIRMYPTNYFTVKSNKTISSIKLNCSTNNAEGNVSAEPGSVKSGDQLINIVDINSKSTKVTNTHTGTGAVSQLRISSMVVTYAD
ncbi:MAG: hypothetical protein K5683_08820 [Prevotella sp.]|nr:hypothetical protein [Prevotella sp.]